jgi:predicted DsbA family dithiol-disulfide isomerase
MPPKEYRDPSTWKRKFGAADGGRRFDPVRAAARAVGLELELDAIKVQPNTLKLHGLVELADGCDKQTALAEAFFQGLLHDGARSLRRRDPAGNRCRGRPGAKG